MPNDDKDVVAGDGPAMVDTFAGCSRNLAGSSWIYFGILAWNNLKGPIDIPADAGNETQKND